jgi:hypothetical protein
LAKKARVYDGTAWQELASAQTDLTGYPALATNQFGFRNKIINGDFRINQRAYVSAANLASGAYGFDRWKSNYTNTTLTFTSAPQGQTVTINVGGSVRQIIERANMPAGTYVLSWTGTAIGSVFNSGATAPVGVLSPLVVTLDGSANVVVEFGPAGAGTATLGNVQLEAGSVPSAFEYRPIGTELALCQRYYYQTDIIPDIFGISFSANVGVFYQVFPVTMRITPTPVYPSTGLTNAVDEFGVGLRTPTALSAAGANTNSDNFQCTGMSGITAGRPLRYVGPALAYGAEL